MFLSGGGPTGQWWMHESWDLPSPPDMVTFAKKFLVGELYYSEDLFSTTYNENFQHMVSHN